MSDLSVLYVVAAVVLGALLVWAAVVLVVAKDAPATGAAPVSTPAEPTVGTDTPPEQAAATSPSDPSDPLERSSS